MNNNIWAKVKNLKDFVLGGAVTGTPLPAEDKYLLDVNIAKTIPTATIPGGGGVSSGLTTEMTSVNDTTWVSLPLVPLAGRAGFTIQNQSGFEVKLNFATPGGYVGVIVADGGERFYDVNPGGILYAKAEPAAAGTISGIIIEELKP